MIYCETIRYDMIYDDIIIIITTTTTTTTTTITITITIVTIIITFIYPRLGFKLQACGVVT